MKKHIYFILILFGIVGSSCTETLEIQPTSLIGVSSFWNTEDDVNGGLTGMYARFRTQAYDNLLFGEDREESY